MLPPSMLYQGISGSSNEIALKETLLESEIAWFIKLDHDLRATSPEYES